MPGWKTVAQPKPVSFSEIMDEALAEKLQQEEDDKYGYPRLTETAARTPSPRGQPQPPTTVPEPQGATLTEDELIAKAIQEEEDRLFALQLQEESEREALEHQHGAQFAKVTYGIDENNDASKSNHTTQATARFSANSTEEDIACCTDGVDDYAYDVVDESEFVERAKKDGIVTKHNPILSGRKNAMRAEQTLNGASGDLSQSLLSNRVYNDLRKQLSNQQKRRVRIKEDKDIARSETVLDERTRLTLLKLINKDIVSELAGSLRSGKECNIYHATQGEYCDPGTGKKPLEDCNEYAVKIFKTMNEFKNADEYLEGELLVQWNNVKHSTGDKTALWAHKELSALRRLHRHGVRCPRPVGLFGHVLLMEFIGKDGVPAPELKEVRTADWDAVYFEALMLLRDMWHRCRLVHADFSEYNILYAPDGTGRCLTVIDLAQAVSTGHPRAHEYLKRDIVTITKFFVRKHVRTLSFEDAWRFIRAHDLSDNVSMRNAKKDLPAQEQALDDELLGAHDELDSLLADPQLKELNEAQTEQPQSEHDTKRKDTEIPPQEDTPHGIVVTQCTTQAEKVDERHEAALGEEGHDVNEDKNDERRIEASEDEADATDASPLTPEELFRSLLSDTKHVLSEQEFLDITVPQKFSEITDPFDTTATSVKLSLL